MLKLKIQLFADDPKPDDDLLEKQYLEQIAELKRKMDEDTVSKAEYEKLLAEHKKLTDDYINRRPVVKQKVELKEPKVYAEKMMKIKQGDISNLEYVRTMLDYRDAFLAKTGRDVFSDFTKEGPGQPTESTKKVASLLRKTVNEAQSPEDFRMKLNLLLKDDPHITSMINKKNKRR